MTGRSSLTETVEQVGVSLAGSRGKLAHTVVVHASARHLDDRSHSRRQATTGTITAVEKTLSRRALGRATLARQLLLERADLGVVQAVEHVVGLQGQVPWVPYLALWNRLAGFSTDDLSRAMLDRSVVRMTLMRGTIHTVSADDARALRPWVQPMLERVFATTPWGKALKGYDIAPALAAAAQLTAEQPRTRAELAPLLTMQFPDFDGTDLSWAFGYLHPVVQPTPRGVWGTAGKSALTPVESWLAGVPPTAPASPAAIVRRFLTAFGPATVADVTTWSGVSRLREAVESLDLRRFRTEEGAELFDVPDGLLPDPDTPAPVRFAPEYENAQLAYDDRSRVIADADHEMLSGGPGGHIGTVLVDGMVRATWAVTGHDEASRLTIRRSGKLTREEQREVESEGRRLLGFVRPGVEPVVSFVDA